MEAKAESSLVFTDTVKLNNGVEMPLIGFGTGVAREVGEDGIYLKRALEKFLQLGGKHIDTARYYGNEKFIGDCLKTLKVDRKELFITSKIWWDRMTFGGALKSVEETLAELQTDYLDLLLLHWPRSDPEKRLETYRAMEKLYDEGKVRALGVSNFYEEALEHLVRNVRVKPAVNQIELHPECFRRSIVEQCKKEDIQIVAYTPIGRNRPSVVGKPILQELAAKHRRTVPQVILKWILSHGIAAVPKSMNDGRIQENLSLKGFELTKEEVEAIDATTNDLKMIDNRELWMGFKYNHETTKE